jgi:hypothetical protein
VRAEAPLFDDAMRLSSSDATALDSARFDFATLPPDPLRLDFARCGGIPAVMPS